MTWLPSSDLAQRWLSIQEGRTQVCKAFWGAPSSLSRHWAGWLRFKEFCQLRGLSQCATDIHTLAEFASLFECEEDEGSADQPGGMPALRGSLAALRWLAKRAQIPSLREALGAPEMLGYASDCKSKSARKEAPPLPLVAVVHLEEVVRSTVWSEADRPMAGFLLTLTWASLRFGDGICTRPGNLFMTQDALLGESWHTKTSDRGMPFGVDGRGLLGGGNWCELYKALIDVWLSGMPAPEAAQVDFLMPSVSKPSLTGLAPVTYVAACVHMRRLLSEVEGITPEVYTLHSCKATVLSWALQLRLPEEDRAKQGHHRTRTSHSVGLYGRDDVAPMLWLQETVRTRIFDGWRPCSAQMRGARPPLAEPTVMLEAPTDTESDDEVPGSLGVAQELEVRACC